MIKYIAKSEYYNIRTGEQITKALAKRDYIKLKTWKTYKDIDAYTKLITYINECQINPQTKITWKKTQNS